MKKISIPILLIIFASLANADTNNCQNIFYKKDGYEECLILDSVQRLDVLSRGELMYSRADAATSTLFKYIFFHDQKDIAHFHNLKDMLNKYETWLNKESSLNFKVYASLKNDKDEDAASIGLKYATKFKQISEKISEFKRECKICNF